MVRKIFLFLAFITMINAQDKSAPQERFNRAVNLYNTGQLGEALTIFTSLAADKSFENRIPAAIFQGKILIHQNKFDEADKIFSDLKNSVRNNYYLNEILLSRSVIRYHQNLFYESAEDLLELLAKTDDKQYSEYARNSLDTLALYKLNPGQLTVLYDISRREVKPLLLLLNGKSLLVSGRRDEGRSIFQKLIKQYPSSPEKKEAEDYYYDRKSVIKMEEGEPVITVLFPKSSEQGNKAIVEITEGIKYAVHEFNSSRSEKVGLVFIDFKSENIKEIKNTILNSNTKCIVGPIFSDDVRLTLSEFRGIKLPIISPTATDNDLTGYNEYFFQANPNFTVRARAMAQYIYYVENKRKIGVLNAIEGYSPWLASAFIREFRSLGGEIVISQTYKSRSGSLDEQLSKLSDVMQSIEGMYVPISDKEDIANILTGLSKSSITVPLYGNQDWFIGRGYESFPMVNNMVFTSDYFIDYNNYAYNMFNDDFRNITKMDAERNVLYGYDLMKYFLNQLTKINAGPEVIADRMMNGNTVTGFHNNICFDEERVNKYINIVRYRDGVFELVDKFKTSN